MVLIPTVRQKHMKPPKKHVSVIDLDFDRVAASDDAGAFSHFKSVCQISRKRIVPKTVKTNAYRVTRTPQSVTIHLLWFDEKKNSEEETFRFSFVPAPKFA